MKVFWGANSSIISIILVVAQLAGNAQEVVGPFGFSKHQSFFSLKSGSSDTLDIPFLIDFNRPDQHVVGFETTSARWSSTNSALPISNGMLVFDGLNADGNLYSEIANSKGECDSLLSKPFNLNYATADSVYLSFYVEKGGYGDKPESSDTLKLDFYNPVDSVWVNVWAESGGSEIGFQQHLIPITNNDFLQKGFRFLFHNVGSLNGNLDNWNLDYVYLDFGRNADDRFRDDNTTLAINTSLLKNYSSIPWSHALTLGTNIYADTTDFFVTNLAENPRLVGNPTISISQNGVQFFSETRLGETRSPDHGEYLAFEFPWGSNGLPPLTLPINSIDTFPSYDVCYSANYLSGFDLIPENDTVCYQQKFEDYYAYDDGSPELAYGINEAGSRVALEYTSYKTDILVGVRMRFNPLDVGITNNSFILSSWSNLENEEVLTENNSFSIPEITQEGDGFVTYYFDEKVEVSGTFYVGFFQTTARPLSVGLDMNTPQTGQLNYSLSGGAWVTSGVPGMPQIQPVFQSHRTLAGMHETAELGNWKVYPNPVQDKVYWNPENGVVYLRDLQGRVIREWDAQTGVGNVERIVPGMYVVNFNNQIAKIIVQ